MAIAMTTHIPQPGQPHSGPIFRPESGPVNPAHLGPSELQNNSYYMEKRQLFLRSYQFSRKQSLKEKIKRSFFRFRRIFWVRIRSGRKIRKVIWTGLRFALYNKRRRLARIMNYYYYYKNNGNNNNNNIHNKNSTPMNYKYYQQLFYDSPQPYACFW